MVSSIKYVCLMLAFFISEQLQASGETTEESSVQSESNGWLLGSILHGFKQFHNQVVDSGTEIRERSIANINNQLKWLSGIKQEEGETNLDQTGSIQKLQDEPDGITESHENVTEEVIAENYLDANEMQCEESGERYNEASENDGSKPDASHLAALIRAFSNIGASMERNVIEAEKIRREDEKRINEWWNSLGKAKSENIENSKINDNDDSIEIQEIVCNVTDESSNVENAASHQIAVAQNASDQCSSEMAQTTIPCTIQLNVSANLSHKDSKLPVNNNSERKVFREKLKKD